MAVANNLPAPTGLSADHAIGRINLAWNRNPEGTVVSYQVLRATAAGGPYETIATLRTARHTDMVAGGTPYFYVVKAVDGAGNVSGPSNEVQRGALRTVRYQEDKGFFTGTWKEKWAWASSGENYKESCEPGATIRFEFTGSRVTWVAMKASNQGIAKVSLDHVFITHVDLYAGPNLWQYPSFVSVPLTYGPHAIQIEVTGTKSAESSGAWVNIDAFDVLQE